MDVGACCRVKNKTSVRWRRTKANAKGDKEGYPVVGVVEGIVCNEICMKLF